MRNSSGQPIRIGAQTITWGESIRENYNDILTVLARESYQGVETGIRHFDLAQPDYYRGLLARHDLTPVATHTGGTFWDPTQAEKEMAAMGDAIAFAKAVGFRFFALSGNKDETAESMVKAAAAYERIGAECREAGLQLVYHNHDWEFADDLALLRVLLDHTNAEHLKLLPDVAWIHRAGVDVPGFLRSHRDRIGYIHLKDAMGDTFCELGRGDVPLSPILDAIAELDVDWVVVEQDTTDTTPEDSLTESAQYLKNAWIL